MFQNRFGHKISCAQGQLNEKPCQTQIHSPLQVSWLIFWPQSGTFLRAELVSVSARVGRRGAPLKSCSACAPRRANFHVSMLILFTARANDRPIERRREKMQAPIAAAALHQVRILQKWNGAKRVSNRFCRAR